MDVGMMMLFSSYGWDDGSDGQMWEEDLRLAGGSRVSLTASEHAACFALLDPPSSFFGHLAERLEVQLSSAMNNGD